MAETISLFEQVDCSFIVRGYHSFNGARPLWWVITFVARFFGEIDFLPEAIKLTTKVKTHIKGGVLCLKSKPLFDIEGNLGNMDILIDGFNAIEKKRLSKR